MKRKVIIGILILLSIFSVGCNSNISYGNKDIIVIDEYAKETTQENNKIELNLLAKLNLDTEYSERDESYKVYFFNDEITEFTIKSIFESYEHQIARHEIISTRIGTVDLLKNEAGFNNITWKETEVKGDLIGESFEGTTFRIRGNNKIYDFINGKLVEIESYKNFDETIINEINDYDEVYSEATDVVYIDGYMDVAIIDLKSNTYLEIENSEDLMKLGENSFKVFGVDGERAYIYAHKLKGHDKLELVLGYMEDNKFYNIFEEENLTVVNQSSINLYNNAAIFNSNKILFSGVIEDVNGIWNYDMENKKLSLQMELDKNVISSLYISPNKEKIIISTSTESEQVLKVSDYIANINEDLEINDISNVAYNMKGDERKYFSGFSQDSKKVYYKSTNKEGDETVYEVYEMKN